MKKNTTMSQLRFLTGLLIILSYSAPSLALKCNSALILEGDTSYKVNKLCSEPQYKDNWKVKYKSFNKNDDSYRSVERTEEHSIWTYNFGPSNLIHYPHFVNNTLSEIETGERGFRTNTNKSFHRCGFLASLDDRKIDIFRKCGKAVQVTKYTERNKQTESDESDGTEIEIISKNIEEWVYDYNDTNFVYYITFSNGRVSHIDHKE